MRILGIDPGYAIIGWGVLDYKGNKFSVVDYGAITTQRNLKLAKWLESDMIIVVSVNFVKRD